MTPFQPAPPPDPLPGFDAEQAQAALDESVARRNHDLAAAHFLLDTSARMDKRPAWPQNVAITPADTLKATSGTILTAPGTTKPANTRPPDG